MNNEHNPNAGYGHNIVWKDFWGKTYSFYAEGYNSPEEAYLRALIIARINGYTIPQWWQWWRWGETNKGGFYLGKNKTNT